MVQNIEFKVGIFIAVATLLIMASLGYVAYKKGAFSRVYTYTLLSKTGDNLTEGMPVVFWGFNIGRVSSMELTERGVVVRIKIPERNNRVIRANSKFILDKPLLGASRLSVTTDNLNGPPLSPEAMPEIGVSNDINELIKKVQPIVEKIDQIAAHVEQVTANLADPQGDVRRILQDVRRILREVELVTANLADPQGDVRRILHSAETLTAKFSAKDSILEMAVGTTATESGKAVQDILNKVRDITVQVEGVLKKADAVDGILKKVDTLAGKADDEIYGRDGVFPLVRNILRDLLAKLAKLDTTLDNINKISGEAADSARDLKVLRSELDATVTAIGNLADELDRKIPFKAKPEIKLP
jgi:phospholipid/cholesterol/gamma-HCH transport system substrate-binding protein